MSKFYLKGFISSLILLVFFATPTIAQTNWCGTVHTKESYDQQTENLKMMQERLLFKSNADKYVPITFILIADDNGNGRLQEEKVFEQVANLNDFFAPQEITFYLDEIRYLDKTIAYNAPGGAGQTSMSLKKDPNAISVYVANTADSGSGTAGTTLAFFSPQRDWLVSRKQEITAESSTLSHEIGHFFSVDHPHTGWECMPYDDELYGNPVNVNTTFPCASGGGSATIELVDGSNCAVAGDRVCDTPADYNFALGPESTGGCSAPTQFMDKNGDAVMPLIENIMGYYPDCSDYSFTQTQQNLINSSYFSFTRAYIRTGVTPNITPVVDDVDYIYPPNGGETEQYDDVTLDWEDVPGADKYLVIIDRFSSFSFNPQKYFIEESELNLADLDLDKTYYWKVWPYNDTQTGHGYSATQSFKATISTGIPTIKEIESISVYPNPMSDQNELFVQLQSSQAFDVTIQLIDIQGQTIQNYGDFNFGTGTQDAIELSTGQLPSGLYFLKLTSENGILTKKVSVQR